MSAVPVLVLKCCHGRVNMYLFACLRERCAGFCFAAERVSDNFRTQTTRMKAWAKLERHVIEGGAPVFAVLPRTRWTILTAVEKDVLQSVCQGPRRPGVNPHWVTRHAARRRLPANLSCAGPGGARMSRSIKKGPYVHPKLMKHVEQVQRSGANTVIRTWARASMIMPEMVGLTIGVHDGRRHIPVFITENMVGHRLGEFSPTRTYRGHISRSERTSRVR